jgi:predicted RNase H-like HicB family nuclease
MATETYTFTAVVNWQGDKYVASSIEFPIIGDDETIEAAIEEIKKEILECLAEGEQPSYAHPQIVPLEISVLQYGENALRNYRFDAVIYEAGPYEGGYCSFCPEVGTASCGDDFDHALAMIKEATELYLECAPVPNYSKPELVTFTLDYQAE